ncbi:MAG: tripeptide aminopeptidase PepT [Elusimicrobiaceae bacterium]|nr:tripeptide aminopeptidase PepT [Elusimicrobiaceae bacterium]
MRLFLSILCTMCLALSIQAQTNSWKAIMRYDKQAAKTALADRLLKYAEIDSHSDPAKNTVPSSKEQLSFAKVLAKELKHIGASKVQVSKTGIVSAEIPATSATNWPAMAFVAHLDTPLADRHPQLHTKYKGGNLKLSKDVLLEESNNPHLLQAHGHDLITSSSTAPLGAQSKNGLSILITLADYLLGNPSIEHGRILLVFLPDGISHAAAQQISPADWNVSYAYMMEGGNIGEYVTDTFSGRQFTITFTGNRQIPLGQALHSSYTDNLLMAADFYTLLPRQYRPESTAQRQGYIAVTQSNTQQDTTTLIGEIRSFTSDGIKELSQNVTNAFNTIKAMYPKQAGSSLSFQDQFQNIRTALPKKFILHTEKTFRQEEIQPKQTALRDTSDAAILSLKGLPTLSLFTGVFNAGTSKEYADVDVMEASLRSAITLATTPAEFAR